MSGLNIQLYCPYIVCLTHTYESTPNSCQHGNVRVAGIGSPDRHWVSRA